MASKPNEPASLKSLWVLEGKLDLPVFFAPVGESGASGVKGLFLDFSGASGDGIIELHACDAHRVNNSVWWSPDAPVLFDFRACVLACSMSEAWMRSGDFLEQMLDRLTFIAGVPVQLIEAGMLYNESQMQLCRTGAATEFECTTYGLPCRTTSPIANVHVVDKLIPSDRAKRALRWFRKAMCSSNAEDRFLAYYFSLECVSNDIKATAVKTHSCQKCGESTGIQKAQTDGIKLLIERHKDLPKSLFRDLGSTRAKLVHGADSSGTEMAIRLEPIARMLAAEGIAMSLQLSPDSIRIQDTSIPVVMPIIRTRYDDASERLDIWGRTMTSMIETLKEMYVNRERVEI
jgi:hypothetical protein